MLVAAVGCASAPPAERSAHSLEGLIWDVRAERFVDRETLLARASAARFVLLGEVHDNAAQHRIQSELIERIAATGPVRSAVFEQIDVGAPLALAPGWERGFYEPLLAGARRAGWRIVAGNVPRQALQSVIRDGFGPAADPRRALLGNWDEEREATLRRLLFDAHCGRVPEAKLEGLARGQRLRDATLAEAALAGAPALAILGNGHARRDIGVPVYLAAREPHATLVSLGMLETSPQRKAPAQYELRSAGGTPLFDFAWFTAPAQRPDPCASFAPP